MTNYDDKGERGGFQETTKNVTWFMNRDLLQMWWQEFSYLEHYEYQSADWDCEGGVIFQTSGSLSVMVVSLIQ